MFIPAISSNINIFSHQKNSNTKNNVSFQAHPDFERLAKDYDICASSFFRRGPFYGSSDNDYIDIIQVLNSLFSKWDKSKKPLKMLLVGIGDSQEPFSILATIKEIIGKKKISKVLNLNIIDLQSKPDSYKLFEDSYFHSPFQPDFSQTSFVKDYMEIKRYGGRFTGVYRVNDEIFDFLISTYKNKKKSLWETRVQEGIKKYNNDSLDVVVINNTLGYISNQDERNLVVKNIFKALKHGGICITDPHYNHIKNARIEKDCSIIKDGIFRKL